METIKLGVGLLAWVLCTAASPQSDRPTQAPQSSQTVNSAVLRSTYVLGPDDTISIRVADAEDLSDKAIRIGIDGTINLPMVGRVRVAGLTADELEKQIISRLKPFIREPEVSINIVEIRKQAVSVIGAVTNPGVQQLQGRKTLVEMLSAAGGPRETAGSTVIITRQKEWGAIPLPGAKMDTSGEFSVAEVNLKDIVDAKNPGSNIPIMPMDIISVPKAQLVYVIGDVKRSGGYVMNEHGQMSVLQALSMAAGFERTANQSKAKILRIADSSEAMKRIEIPVNLRAMLAGKAEDLALRPEDILVVSGSKSKSATLRALEVAVQVGTGIAIYRTAY